MISQLVLVLLSGSPVAQDLANASRQLESAVATHSPTESRQAEIDALVERWVREELEATTGLPLEARVARYYRLLEVTSLASSGVAALRETIEKQAESTFRAWLDQGDALLAANKPMRVLALRKQFTNAVGKGSALRSLRADLDPKALAQLQFGDGAFAHFASQSLEALVDGRSVELPADLARFRFLRTAPKPSSACALTP